MQPHLLPLVGAQRSGLLPDPGVHRHPPDVVDERRVPEPRDARVVDPAPRRRRGGQLRHAGGMTGQRGRDQIGEVAHRRKPLFECLPLERPRWPRLAGEGLLPHRGLLARGEDLGGVVDEAGRDVRGRRRGPPLAGDPHHALLAPEHALEGGVHGQRHDPHRQRDLIALRAAERAVSVPAFEQVRGQTLLHGAGKAEPVGQHPRHLARGGEVRALLSHHPRQPAGDLSRARRPRDSRDREARGSARSAPAG